MIFLLQIHHSLMMVSLNQSCKIPDNSQSVNEVVSVDNDDMSLQKQST